MKIKEKKNLTGEKKKARKEGILANEWTGKRSSTRLREKGSRRWEKGHRTISNRWKPFFGDGKSRLRLLLRRG